MVVVARHFLPSAHILCILYRTIFISFSLFLFSKERFSVWHINGNTLNMKTTKNLGTDKFLKAILMSDLKKFRNKPEPKLTLVQHA